DQGRWSLPRVRPTVTCPLHRAAASAAHGKSPPAPGSCLLLLLFPPREIGNLVIVVCLVERSRPVKIVLLDVHRIDPQLNTTIIDIPHISKRAGKAGNSRRVDAVQQVLGRLVIIVKDEI